MRIIIDDCRAAIRGLIAEGVKVNCCVTSPPYFGLTLVGFIIGPRLGLAHFIMAIGMMACALGMVRDHNQINTLLNNLLLVATIIVGFPLFLRGDGATRATEWWHRKWREWRRAHLRIKYPDEVWTCQLCRNKYPFERRMYAELRLGGGVRGFMLCEECGEHVLEDKRCLSLQTFEAIAENGH